MGIGEQALSSLTGNIETAVLVIHDYREQAKQQVSQFGSGDAVQDNLNVMSSLGQLRAEATQAALSAGSVPSYEGSQDRILKVQFNPAQLTLNSAVKPQNKKDGTSENSRTIANWDPQMTMTTTLYFDDMDTYDAFMWEKFTATLSVQGISNIAKGAAEGMGISRVHSVQDRVEALVAALRNPYTRTISFRWADFSFIGTLNTVRASYTMFSTSGRPIRAAVQLRLKHEMDPRMLTGWSKSFSTAFGGGRNNLVQPEQTTTNLLNLVL